jgi:hypothetical protein
VATGTRRTRKNNVKAIDPAKGISGDYSDVEVKEGMYDGEPPTPGLYKGVLSSVGQHTTSDDAVVWTFDITDGKYAGWRGWVYTNNTTAKWKQQDILVALGLMEVGGSCSLSYEEIMRKAAPVRLRVISEPYGEEMRPKVRTVMAAAEAADVAEDDDDNDPDFQDEPVKPTRAQGRKAKDPEPEPDPDEDDGDGDEEDEELAELREELDGLTLVKLKARAKADYDATVADLKGLDKAGVIEFIMAQEAGDPDAEEEAGDEDGGGEDEGIDLDALEEELSDLGSADLLEKAKEFKLWSTRTEKKKYAAMSDDDLIEAILDAAEEMAPGF